MTALAFGIRENLTQFSHQLIQVLLVGFAIGMTRTVVPALAESEFGVACVFHAHVAIDSMNMWPPVPR